MVRVFEQMVGPLENVSRYVDGAWVFSCQILGLGASISIFCVVTITTYSVHHH
jgi:hypothetical protein